MGYCLLTYVCSEEKIWHNVNNPVYDLPSKEGKILTIDGNTVDGR